jgi:hypothetical protein
MALVLGIVQKTSYDSFINKFLSSVPDSKILYYYMLLSYVYSKYEEAKTGTSYYFLLHSVPL